ncbi:ABC transporter substrate-binding protein [Caulobacter segnis]
MVFPYSMHNYLLLRYWPAGGGVDPDRDVRLERHPAARLWSSGCARARSTASAVGALPGCTVAEADGVGRILIAASQFWPRRSEDKVLGVSAALAERRPDELRALLLSSGGHARRGLGPTRPGPRNAGRGTLKRRPDRVGARRPPPSAAGAGERNRLPSRRRRPAAPRLPGLWFSVANDALGADRLRARPARRWSTASIALTSIRQRPPLSLGAGSGAGPGFRRRRRACRGAAVRRSGLRPAGRARLRRQLRHRASAGDLPAAHASCRAPLVHANAEQPCAAAACTGAATRRDQ